MFLTNITDCDILFLHLNDDEAFKRVIHQKYLSMLYRKPILAGVDGIQTDLLKKYYK